MNRTALVITIALTAFMLTVGAGVYFGVRTAQTVLASSPTQAVPTEVAITNQPIEQQIQQAVQQRDQAYKDLLDQANARIDALQKENQSLKEQLSAAQSSGVASNGAANNGAASNNQVGISPNMAAQIAASFLGDNQVFSVESVTIQDIPLDKVTFSSGAVVYVDMNGTVVGSVAPNGFQISPGEAGESEGGHD